MGSLLGARDREYGVSRLKPVLLENVLHCRDPQLYIACDEQINPYTGAKSGLKKRLPKKTSEGIEYITIATSNKGYENYRGEERAESQEGEIRGKIIRPADPVCGGLKLNWIMQGGRRYEVGTPNPSKFFGAMTLLIFELGAYLRFRDIILVTDSAYGFLECMFFMTI